MLSFFEVRPSVIADRQMTGFLSRGLARLLGSGVRRVFPVCHILPFIDSFPNLTKYCLSLFLLLLCTCTYTNTNTHAHALLKKNQYTGYYKTTILRKENKAYIVQDFYNKF